MRRRPPGCSQSPFPTSSCNGHCCPLGLRAGKMELPSLPELPFLTRSQKKTVTLMPQRVNDKTCSPDQDVLPHQVPRYPTPLPQSWERNPSPLQTGICEMTVLSFKQNNLRDSCGLGWPATPCAASDGHDPGPPAFASLVLGCRMCPTLLWSSILRNEILVVFRACCMARENVIGLFFPLRKGFSGLGI